MGDLYYSCDWITQWDKINIDFVFDKLREYECEIALVYSYRDKQGNQILGIGVKASSESLFWRMVQNIGHLYGATTWNTLTEQAFVAGKHLDGSEENRKHLHEEIQLKLKYESTTYDLHQRIDKENLQIYTSDWLIKSNPSVYHLFNSADLTGFPLAFTYVEDAQGFLYLRFFAIAQSFETISDFVKAIPAEMELVEWEKIDKYRLPNILHFDPRKFNDINFMTKWGENLGELANHNRRLAQRNRLVK